MNDDEKFVAWMFIDGNPIEVIAESDAKSVGEKYYCQCSNCKKSITDGEMTSYVDKTALFTTRQECIDSVIKAHETAIEKLKALNNPLSPPAHSGGWGDFRPRGETWI
jgi:hypothetical protein